MAQLVLLVALSPVPSHGKGATVFITGRTRDKLEKLANEINSAGGKAVVGIVDAMNIEGVNNHMEGIVNSVGKIDISFNAIELKISRTLH